MSFTTIIVIKYNANCQWKRTAQLLLLTVDINVNQQSVCLVSFLLSSVKLHFRAWG